MLSSIPVSPYALSVLLNNDRDLSVAKGVEDSAADIEKTREEVLSAFEHHVTKVSPYGHMPFRLASLLLLLPPIMSIARDLAEEAQLAKLFGLANIDTLMAELMLPEDAENNSYQHLKKVTGATSITSALSSQSEANDNHISTVPQSASVQLDPQLLVSTIGGSNSTLFHMAPAPIQTAPPTQAPGQIPLPLSLPISVAATIEQIKNSGNGFTPGHLFL